MKTNEAPEKLYFGLQGDTGILDIYSKRESENDIEYIRKDAFIEKVLDYIENNIYDYYDGDHEYGICKKEFIEDLKKYMKGEKV